MSIDVQLPLPPSARIREEDRLAWIGASDGRLGVSPC